MIMDMNQHVLAGPILGIPVPVPPSDETHQQYNTTGISSIGTDSGTNDDSDLIMEQAVESLDSPTDSSDTTSDSLTKNEPESCPHKIRRLLARSHRVVKPFMSTSAGQKTCDAILEAFFKTIKSQKELDDVRRIPMYRRLLRSYYIDCVCPPKDGTSSIDHVPSGVTWSDQIDDTSPADLKPTIWLAHEHNRPDDRSHGHTEAQATNDRSDHGPYEIMDTFIPSDPKTEPILPPQHTIRIVSRGDAFHEADRAYEAPTQDHQSHPFIIWTDGSAENKENTPMAAAGVYQRPSDMPYPEWAVHAFGIAGYPGRAHTAEFIAVEQGLIIALREWHARQWEADASTAGDWEDMDEDSPAQNRNQESAWEGDEVGERVRNADLQYSEGEVDRDTSDGTLDEDGNILAETWLPSSPSSSPFTEVHLYTDSQFVLRALEHPWPPAFSVEPLSNIYANVISLLEQLSAKGVTVRLRWVPAHEGVQGNDMADQACGMARKLVSSALCDEGPRVWEVDVPIDDPGAVQSLCRPGLGKIMMNLRRKKRHEHVGMAVEIRPEGSKKLRNRQRQKERRRELKRERKKLRLAAVLAGELLTD